MPVDQSVLGKIGADVGMAEYVFKRLIEGPGTHSFELRLPSLFGEMLFVFAFNSDPLLIAQAHP